MALPPRPAGIDGIAPWNSRRSTHLRITRHRIKELTYAFGADGFCSRCCSGTEAALRFQEREDATRLRGRVIRSCHIERLTVTAILKVTRTGCGIDLAEDLPEAGAAGSVPPESAHCYQLPLAPPPPLDPPPKPSNPPKPEEPKPPPDELPL